MQPDKSEWTAELVRAHVVALLEAGDRRYEERFEAQEKAVNAALAASEKAVKVAEINAEKWRDNANEWRAAMTDREGKFATKQEYDLLKERIDRSEGGSKGMRDLWGWIAAAVMAGVTLFSLWIG